MDIINRSSNIKVMARFVELKQSDSNKIVVLTKVNYCVCCGAMNMGLIKLRNCSHKSFLECYFKNRVNLAVTVVCHYCHGILKKIDDFKKQVEHCLTSQQAMLNSTPKLAILPEPITTTITPESLREPPTHTSIPSPTHIEPEMWVKEEPVDVIKPEYDDMGNKYQIDVKGLTEEDDPVGDPSVIDKIEILKVEPNIEAPQPQSIDHKAKTPSKFEVKNKVKNLPPIDKRLLGKVQLVNMTREQAENEREQERKEDRYTSLESKCEMCIVAFSHKDVLARHMKKHDTSRGNYVCPVCTCVYGTEIQLQSHLQTHYRRYQCVPCGKMFKGLIHPAIVHYNKEHAAAGDVINNIIECHKEDCDFTTTDLAEYRRHRNSHRKRVNCDECGNTYSCNYVLNVHKQTAHNNKHTIYKCKDCDKMYKTSTGLAVHRQNCHVPIDERPLIQCNVCGEQFKNTWMLYSHKKKHFGKGDTEVKSYICDICKQKFRHKDSLRSHMEMRHVNIQYKCSQCDKVVRTHKALLRHRNENHTSNKTPKPKCLCDLCGKEFLTKTILQQHMTTHTGERPYSCSLCSATFGFSAALYTHKRLVHKQPKLRK